SPSLTTALGLGLGRGVRPNAFSINATSSAVFLGSTLISRLHHRRIKLTNQSLNYLMFPLPSRLMPSNTSAAYLDLPIKSNANSVPIPIHIVGSYAYCAIPNYLTVNANQSWAVWLKPTYIS